MGEEVKDEGTEEEAKETETGAEESPEEEKAEPTVDEKPLDKMTAPELREVAKQIPGITGASAMKKAELLSIIKEFRGIKDEDPAKKKKKTVVIAQSPRELKIKIARLREEQKKAREAKDKKQLDMLRRRINRMKKLTRKAAPA